MSGLDADVFGMAIKEGTEAGWLSVTEAAEAVGMSRKFIVREIERRAIKVYRFGRVHRIRRADLDVYIEARLIDAEAS